MLDRGAACLQCRKLKMKCDGLLPHCSRCARLHKECAYPRGVAKRPPRPVTESLQARILELEMMIHKLTVPSTYNLSMISEKLRERGARLGRSPEPRQLFNEGKISPNPSKIPTVPNPPSERGGGKVLGGDNLSEDPSEIQVLVEQELLSYNLALPGGVEQLPPPLSMNLIKLFLPYYAHYYFLADVSYFIPRVSLPPSHPESIHPCLLNACYLAACTSNGSGLASFKAFFLQRTRHFLQHSLMFSDRTTDFLWASLILGVFFAKERRVVESMAMAAATAHFALACGLSLPGTSARRKGSSMNEHLLPPPRDKAEANDRVRLAHSIFFGCQALPLLSGNPLAFPYENQWSDAEEEVLSDCQDAKARFCSISMTKDDLWRSELRLRVLVINTFERSTKFARSVAANSHPGEEDEQEYLTIESQIHAQRASFPPLYDPHKLRPPGVSNKFTSQSVFGYLTLYGSGLIIHSLWAIHRAESRAKMFECVRALVDICAGARGHRGLYLGLASAVHIMNAIRIIARELRRSEAKANSALSINYCQSLEVLLDALEDIMSVFPAWADTPAVLRDTLLATADSLST
ncbi:hypothetical protein DL93DRAFT_2231211 [Clavulina sp. PMI_390]|nr:hypothetical protein DL93DRAFT_2231211 [Clavulina sp. PMI_390]